MLYYARLIIELSRRGWRRAEPEGLPRESSQVFDKVFGHWREKGLTPSMIAEQLHLNPDVLSGLVFGRILHTLNGQGQTTSRPPPSPLPGARSGLQLVR